MVVFDEFSIESLLDGSGRVDASLYPELRELAGDATWYRNETTVAPYTEAAVPAILTGEFPTTRTRWRSRRPSPRTSSRCLATPTR